METIQIVPDITLRELIERKTQALDQEFIDDPFMLVDVGNIIERYDEWVKELPNVEPFYAVKCNPDPVLLRTLLKLGVNFDCASMGEIELMLKTGATADRIIYANTIKAVSHLRFARQSNVNLTVFDNEDELRKIKQYHPDARLAIRICPDMEACESRYQLGIKFGAAKPDVAHLLSLAKSLELNVVGVSFHVGSDCLNAAAYAQGIRTSKQIFNMAKEFDYHFELLDIGGGFTAFSSQEMTFAKAAVAIRQALQEYFPTTSGVRIIAEPGRYFATRACTLVANIIGKRVVRKGNNDPFEFDRDNAHLHKNTNEFEKVLYYINDSIYGCLNILLVDGDFISLKPVKNDGDDKEKAILFGQTCDSLDCLLKECQLPKLNAGDWVYFEGERPTAQHYGSNGIELGAYSICLASKFNSFKKPKCQYFIQEDFWHRIQGKTDFPFNFVKSKC